MLASWDADEVGLIGSTETTELLRQELSRRAIAYLNADCPVKGSAGFWGRCDQLLADSLLATANEVHTSTGETFYKVWQRMQNKSYDEEPA